MSDEPKRYYVVKHTFTVVHDYPVKYDESAEYALTEGNVVEALHECNEFHSKHSQCSLCTYHEAKVVGRYDTLDEALLNQPGHSGAFPLDLEYWKEQQREHEELMK